MLKSEAWPNEATRGSSRAQKPIREEAEHRLVVALARYDVTRQERLRIEKHARQAREDRVTEKVDRALGVRGRARVVRPELDRVSSAIAAILADHADLLEGT